MGGKTQGTGTCFTSPSSFAALALRRLRLEQADGLTYLVKHRSVFYGNYQLSHILYLFINRENSNNFWFSSRLIVPLHTICDQRNRPCDLPIFSNVIDQVLFERTPLN